MPEHFSGRQIQCVSSSEYSIFRKIIGRVVVRRRCACRISYVLFTSNLSIERRVAVIEGLIKTFICTEGILSVNEVNKKYVALSELYNVSSNIQYFSWRTWDRKKKNNCVHWMTGRTVKCKMNLMLKFVALCTIPSDQSPVLWQGWRH
jgi:hypothetical protein